MSPCWCSSGENERGTTSHLPGRLSSSTGGRAGWSSESLCVRCVSCSEKDVLVMCF